MKATDIMHPEDAKAIQVIQKTKSLNPLVRKIMAYGYENKFRGINLGSETLNGVCTTHTTEFTSSQVHKR